MPATADRATRSHSISSADGDLFRALPGATPDETRQIDALLVGRYSGLVGWMAAGYGGRGVVAEELRQVGYVGLMLAIRRFDVERGGLFIAFARPTVQGEIQRYFRDRRRWIRLPRRLQELKAELRVAEDELVQSLGRCPTTDELAVATGICEDLVREAMAADDTYDLVCLDSALSSDGEQALALVDTIGDHDPQMDKVVDRQSLRPMIAKLPERERRILHLRFFREQTQAQIGQQLGISQMHVSRLLAHTLGELRAGMETVDPPLANGSRCGGAQR